MGPGSWGWVERSYASNRAIDRPGFLENIAIPTFVVATDHDRLVEYRAIERAMARLPRGELFLFGEEANHEILREVDAVRDLALEGIDGFLTLIAAKGDMSPA
jgi:lysophospholipase